MRRRIRRNCRSTLLAPGLEHNVRNALGVSGDADRVRHDGRAVVRVVLVGVNGTLLSVATADDSVVDVNSAVDVNSVVDGDTVEATPMSVTGLDTVEP